MTSADRLKQQLVDAAEVHLRTRTVPRLPEAGRLAWRWFVDLTATRTSNGYGPNPISYSEIAAYAQLFRWPLQARHVELIRALDDVWLRHVREARGQTSPTPVAPRPTDQALNPAAFDAVFG